MGAQGITTVDFGAFPGNTDATVTITGQGSIAADSLVEAWIMPTATADHSADEHWLDAPHVMAGNVSAGVGFTIYARSKTHEQMANDAINGNGRLKPSILNDDRFYGLYTVAWVWN